MSQAFLFLCFLAGWAADPSAEDIVKRADEARGPEGSFSFTVKVEDYSGNDTARETAYKVWSKNMQYTLIETTAPERQKGRKLLMRENDLWMYLPTLKRPTRVSLQQRLTGEVSNGDIARTNFSKDYDSRILATEKCGDAQCWKLELKAKHKDVTYNKITYWVDKSTFRPVKSEYYALSGKLLKTGEYSEFKPILGKPRMTRMEIKDAINPSKRSVLHYSDYKLEKLDDSFFNKESIAE